MEYQLKIHCKMIALLLVISWSGFCAAQSGCQLPLGMESGAILDSQITATSWLTILDGPRYARLHKRDGGGGWTAGTLDTSEYLTIDLASVATVTGVATQGRFGSDDYVTSYKLQYSLDGSKWTTYSGQDGSDMLFEGNIDSTLTRKTILPNSVEARYVRFNPQLFNGSPTMRVEVYGCFKDTAYLDGNTYMKYDISGASDIIQAEEDMVMMRFRTMNPDGLLLAGWGTQSDYLFLQLRGGKVLLSINLGDIANEPGFGATELEGGSLLDDNHWHLVEYKRHRQTIELTVDGNRVTKNTNGYFSRLDLNKEVTVGGTSLRQHIGLSVTQSFVGCMQNVLLSNSVDPVSLGTALNFIKGLREDTSPLLSVSGQLDYDCQGEQTMPATFPTKESFISWPGPKLSQSFIVSLQFRTLSDNVLLVYNKLVSSTGGSITLGIKDGIPISVLKLGSDTTTVFGAVGYDLNDGKWHSLRLEMANNVYRWTLDGETDSKQQSFSINTEENYFLGSIDEGATSILQSMGLEGFRGCMKDVYLGDTKVDFESILSQTMPDNAVISAVDIDTCSMEDWCTPNPCANEGTCRSDWDTFECTCTDTGYTGTTCSVAEHGKECTYAGRLTIDVDGSGPLPPFKVDCEMQGDNVFTVIHHDAETQEEVTPGSEAAGSYSRDITYEAMTDQIQAVVARAEYCEQDIQYECRRSRLLNSPNGEPYGWWVNNNGQAMDYWGGSAPGTRKCACGLLGTCSNRAKWCNCDAADGQTRTDEGLLKHKQYLPVKQLRFGDVGTDASGKHTLGPLKCKGNVYEDNIVTFRSREAHLLFPVDSFRSTSLEMSFKFKTTQSASVLLAADGLHDTFVKLEMMESGSMRLSLDYGAGLKAVSVTPSESFSDNMWHSVVLFLNPKMASLSLDGRGAEEVNYDMGKMRLHLTDDLVIGASTLQSEGFVGCMGNLHINGRFIDLKAAGIPARQVDEGCSGKCDYKPCLNDGYCEETYDEIECQCSNTAFEGPFCSREIGSRMEKQSEITYDVPAIDVQEWEQDTIVLAFTTNVAGGRLLRVENSRNAAGMYEELVLTNPEGHLMFTYNLGAGPQTVTSERNYADGKHHYVNIQRDGNKASLRVDDYQPITNEGGNSVFQLADKIYVGSTDAAKSFEGCISRVKVNDYFPLSALYASPPAEGAGSSGNLQKSRCNVVELIPTLPKPEGPLPTTKAPTTDDAGPLPPAAQTLAAGDKAAIAFVIIILLLALIVLIVLVTRYMHQHKGQYHTNEAQGADYANDADTAVMMSGGKHVAPNKKREYYI